MYKDPERTPNIIPYRKTKIVKLFITKELQKTLIPNKVELINMRSLNPILFARIGPKGVPILSEIVTKGVTIATSSFE